jgi:NitT/TauT family transport system substrate-binding protein
VEHIELTTQLMQKYGVGRMAAPPRAADWVKLDLLAKAEEEQKPVASVNPK